MKTYYVIVDVEDKRLGAYVPAEDVEGAFTTATARYKMRHPRLHVETIAVQEMTARYVDPALFRCASHCVSRPMIRASSCIRPREQIGPIRPQV